MEIKVGKFPSDSEKVRIYEVTTYLDLYENRQKGVLGLHEIIENQYKNAKDVVYLAHAIPARISDFYGDFVQGNVSQLTITTEEENHQEFINGVVDFNDLKEMVYDMGVDQSEFGYFALHTWKDENDRTYIDLIPQDQFFPQSDGSVIISTYKKDDRGVTDQFYALTQNYQLEGDKVVITRQGWKADSKGVLVEEVNIKVLNELIGIEYEETQTLEIDTIPIIQVDNGRPMSSGYGKSDYNDILPQLAELNERATHISTQLLKNLDAKMQIPKTDQTTDEDGNLKQWDTLVVEGKEHADAKYILNTNPLIESTEKHIELQVKMISFLSSVPMFELLKSSMPERVEALRIQLFSAIRKTDTKRSKIEKGLKDILKIAGKLSSIEIEDITMKFGDVLPVDEYQQARTEEVRIKSGNTSKQSSIKRLDNVNDEVADEELEKISEEDKIAGVGDTVPTL